MSHASTDDTARPAALARAALTAAALFWSGNFVAGRALAGAVDPVTLNALRWTIAAALFLPFAGRALWLRRDVVRREWALIAALSAAGVIAFQVLVYKALTQIPVVNAVLVLATMPVVILIGAVLLGQRRPGLGDLAAVILSMTGVAVLLSEGDLTSLSALRVGQGDLWMFAAVLAWSAYTLLLRRTPADLPGDVLVLAMMLPALPVLIGWALASGTTDLAALGWRPWALVLYIGLFPSLLAFLCWNYGVSKAGAAEAGFYINLMPVFATLLAFLLLGETVSSAQFAGAGFIIAAIVITQRRARTKRPPDG